MNYLFYRRIKGPVFLLTFGVTALLAQLHVLSFSRSWPLYLIVFGVLRLAAGAALAASGPVPFYAPQGYAPQGYAPYGGTPYQAAGPGAGAAPGTGLATIAPAPLQTAATTEEES